MITAILSWYKTTPALTAVQSCQTLLTAALTAKYLLVTISSIQTKAQYNQEKNQFLSRLSNHQRIDGYGACFASILLFLITLGVEKPKHYWAYFGAETALAVLLIPVLLINSRPTDRNVSFTPRRFGQDLFKSAEDCIEGPLVAAPTSAPAQRTSVRAMSEAEKKRFKTELNKVVTAISGAQKKNDQTKKDALTKFFPLYHFIQSHLSDHTETSKALSLLHECFTLDCKIRAHTAHNQSERRVNLRLIDLDITKTFDSDALFGEVLDLIREVQKALTNPTAVSSAPAPVPVRVPVPVIVNYSVGQPHLLGPANTGHPFVGEEPKEEGELKETKAAL